MRGERMKKRLVIHDLSEKTFSELDLNLENTEVIVADGKYAPCQGCFGCWLKTPGKCVMKDRLQDIGRKLAKSNEVLIISQNCYGGFSPQIKNILDRGIATSLPFFTYRGGRLHHMLRYGKQRSHLIACLYGEMTPLEKETAQKFVHANEINGSYKSSTLLVAPDEAHIKEVLV